jgi:hypothetical protein
VIVLFVLLLILIVTYMFYVSFILCFLKCVMYFVAGGGLLYVSFIFICEYGLLPRMLDSTGDPERVRTVVQRRGAAGPRSPNHFVGHVAFTDTQLLPTMRGDDPYLTGCLILARPSHCWGSGGGSQHPQQLKGHTFEKVC